MQHVHVRDGVFFQECTQCARALSHLCVGVYTEQTRARGHLISLHLIMGFFYLGFQFSASQASGSTYGRTSQKHCNNKVNLTPYK